jgi:hypothetical protein
MSRFIICRPALSSSIGKVIRSRRKTWAGHLTRIIETINACNILVVKSKEDIIFETRT